MSRNIQHNQQELQSHAVTALYVPNHNSFYLCILCGFIYPDTDWHTLSPDWRCPDCGASKKNFDSTKLDLD